MTKKLKIIAAVVVVCLIANFCVLLYGCSTSNKQSLPEGVSINNGEPQIRVFNTSTNKTKEMDLEDYVAGVVAGEVYNTWDDEALKTQCVLSRTFALKYAKDNPESYHERGIPTSIADAQSYDEDTVNDKIKNAVKATKGQVITYNNELIDAYFHSNSGGETTSTKIGISHRDSEPAYIKPTTSPETASNSKNYSWSYTFSKGEVLSALSKMGVTVATLSSAALGEQSTGGFYATIMLGGKEVSANTLRKNLGTTKMKSTKLISVKISGNNVILSGLGYGHGVGVSQWGAQILASQGKTYTEILNHYFNGIKIKTVS